ncbi:FMN-dependent NADH-azoreductase [Azospirillum doebereinerae]|uniref:FMN dependent NADH:quinone oxidoreductase n=1 Tax=Azospirillum doebereinerae TaxID=92933 RepID=A0A433JC13_9PROT|nr:FMN-dependent NADH-azoreductase [Azospirillum doebereinerae]MCG5239626.1 FMN-dependent NADH-azoreductase [Azospirillum doebereinerae]RUQ74138.1 FMN-dependent NADH-azoreductase [Azospirillum doebereinerae]
MTKILHIDSSPLGAASVTRQLTASVVEALRKAEPAAEVAYRDVAANPPDHLSGELLQVVKFRNLDGLNDRQKAELALTDELVDEFLAADVVVIGAPMYNFSIPTQLKAWIDRLAQVGRTFRYTETGPQGLAGGKRVIVASGRGGVYSTNPVMVALDHQEAYLRTVLGFFGVTDVTFVRAEGVGMGPDAKAKAFESADREIEALFTAA